MDYRLFIGSFLTNPAFGLRITGASSIKTAGGPDAQPFIRHEKWVPHVRIFGRGIARTSIIKPCHPERSEGSAVVFKSDPTNAPDPQALSPPCAL
jgi:hypothetical protein